MGILSGKKFLNFAVMTKFKLPGLLFGMLMVPSLCLSQSQSFADTAAIYFEEVKAVTKQNAGIWDYDLYAPLLLVNPETREVFANVMDSAGVLKPVGKIFSGNLPKQVNISNTSLQWNGVNWAMIMLPLSQNKSSRISLLTHELFHRAQKTLSFFAYNPDNNHLDKKDGRIYLRLELEALQKAVLADSPKELKLHIANALAFRSYRQSLYPGADSTENLLELNEGICEFTGVMMSGRSPEVIRSHFTKKVTDFIFSPSYIRSFAYETIPIYGYLLSSINKKWNKEINSRTNLRVYFQKAFDVKLPAGLSKYINKVADQYNGKLIIAEETAREEKIAKQLAAYKMELIDSAHTELPLVNMNMSFDYTKMVPLENFGTVYPIIRITDNWGILDVERAALISSKWNQVNVGYPLSVKGNKVSGNGWKLELKEGYTLVKDEKLGNYVLKKQ